jgi:gluconolactonase
VLYVTDSGANQEPGSYYVDRAHHIKAFDVVGGRRLAGERLFAVIAPGFPDGLKVDCAGRVYASSFSGVQVLDPDGGVLGEIRVPGAVNFCFGGTERNLLLITTDSAV